MVTLIDDPFEDDTIEELHLPDAPLVRVLSQIRFPKMPEITSDPGIAPLRARLKHRYPILREDRGFALVVSGAGVTSQSDSPETLWRLVDQDDIWRVTTSDTFVALETSKYSSRTDFFDRFDEIVKAVADLYEPILFDRLGVRYVDRMEGDEALSSLTRYVNPALLCGPLLEPPPGVILQHSLSQALYQFPDANLQARWGVLPGGMTIEPSIPAAQARSWILDLDVFSQGTGAFDPVAISPLARRFSERAYRFFRWATTPEFLKEVGGLL
jgi:uncharacterized protein (TIGR04255 family)